MKKIIIAAISGLGIFLTTTGCYNDKYQDLYPTPTVVTCDTANMSFATNILPIFNDKCATTGCHTTADKASAGNIDLSNYAGATTVRVKNNILDDINFTGNPMPQGGTKLDDCSINKITAWIHQGCKN